jgi:hypothetical protein
MKLRSRIVAAILFGIGAVIFGYLWKVLGDRGIWADQTGAGGYTTSTELALLITSLLLLLLSAVLFINSLRHKKE